MTVGQTAVEQSQLVSPSFPLFPLSPSLSPFSDCHFVHFWLTQCIALRQPALRFPVVRAWSSCPFGLVCLCLWLCFALVHTKIYVYWRLSTIYSNLLWQLLLRCLCLCLVAWRINRGSREGGVNHAQLIDVPCACSIAQNFIPNAGGSIKRKTREREREKEGEKEGERHFRKFVIANWS